MTATVIDGRAVARELAESVKAQVKSLGDDSGVLPTLRVVLLGDDQTARLYADRLQRAGVDLGLSVTVDHHQATVTDSELGKIVADLNSQPALDGVVVAMPLPAHLSANVISSGLNPRKDVDGFTVANAGRLYLGHPAHVPSTAMAIMHLLKAYQCALDGRNAVVVGRSPVVGRPVALLLLREHAAVTLTHTHTLDLAFHTRDADILVVAAGRPGLITGDMIKAGAIVIDAGINIVNGGVVGDVDFEQGREVASLITPVPGGVGPLTNIMVLRQVVENAERRARQG